MDLNAILNDLNWTAIEALAGVAGVIGLIISIIFLVYEVRHNARAIEGETIQSLMSFEREVFAMMIEHSDLFQRGCTDFEALSDAERFQFDRLLGAQFSLLYSAFIQFERGLMEADVWEAYMNSLSRYAIYPAYALIWKNIRASYPPGMHAAIDKVISHERKRTGALPWEDEAFA